MGVQLASSQLGIDAEDLVIIVSFPALVFFAMRWFRWRHHTYYRSIRLHCLALVFGPVIFLFVPKYLQEIWFIAASYLVLLVLVRLEVSMQTRRRGHAKISGQSRNDVDVWFGRANDDKDM